MKFHKFMEDALGNRTKIGVLRALCAHPTQEFTQREFSKKFGIPQQSVSVALKDLSRHNLILVRTVGRSTVFAANADSYSFKSVKKLFEDEKKVLAALKETIAKELSGCGGIVECVLFGSVARGKEKTGSDIDLFVVCDDAYEEKIRERITMLNGKIIRRYGNPLSPLIVSAESLKKWKQENQFLYTDNILKDGIKLDVS